MITVTAFGPFGKFKHNPSEILGRTVVGDSLVVLPVSFSAVDDFVRSLPNEGKLLMLGVAGNAKSIRIERVATSCVGESRDICDERRHRGNSGKVCGQLLQKIAASDFCHDSEDAGDYLCNYLYYEATSARPAMQTGFVHVPPFSTIPMPIQAVRLKRLFNLLCTQ
jgi:pyrrolidone-carboxylate peptidase